MTNTFSGIRLADVPAFILAQAIGATLATALFLWIAPTAVRRPAVEPLDPS